MIAVLMVQVPGDDVIDVVAMRNRRMAAIGAVPVRLVVAFAVVFRSTAGGIAGAHADPVFIHVISVNVMQVPVVKIIDVPVVAHRGVPAIWSMRVRMMLVNVMFGCHDALLLAMRSQADRVR